MNIIPSHFALFLMLAFFLSGCEKKEEPIKQQDVQPVATSTAPIQAARSVPASDTATAGFDVNKAPVVNPQLGKFPYVGLIEGYKQSAGYPDWNKDSAFDKYEFYDGAKLIPVEGRLQTIEAGGKGASAFEIFKTYESLVAGLGGVKVYEGKLDLIWDRKLTFTDERHRKSVLPEDRVGVYMLRAPEKEIWVEAFVSSLYLNKDRYFLTVVEKKALQVRAALLAAEEMKKELDARGHVALYIHFDFDKAEIKPESQPIIDEIVKLLKNNPGLSLTVEGHTDNVGAPDYNRRLSDARAHSVVAALTGRAIGSGRLKAVGYGQDKPISDNSNEEGKAKNRRVELVKM